ncbi:MAG: Hpt domain-containing protein [Lachnospiraceae bacterium]|nr:Hpt domain-containing protein [Lachnospiraceae bacterium]
MEPDKREDKCPNEVLLKDCPVSIDQNLGITACGTEALFYEVLQEFSLTANKKMEEIKGYLEQQDIKNYTIQVHALKSSARLAGATELSELAAKLEACGLAGENEVIYKESDTLLQSYKQMAEDISDFLLNKQEKQNKPLIEPMILKNALVALKQVIENFDFDSGDYIMERLNKFTIPEEYVENFRKLKTLMTEVARDDIILLLNDVIHNMGKV